MQNIRMGEAENDERKTGLLIRREKVCLGMMV